MNYKVFKNEVANLQEYKDKADRLRTQIEDIIYIYQGVKGVSFDNQPSQYNQAEADMKLVELSEKLTPYQKQLEWYIDTIVNIEDNIALLPEETQEMVKLLFMKGISFEQVGKMYGYSPNGVYLKVRREIERI